jgi:hypothetical protein
MMLAINLAFDPRNRMTMDVIGPIVFIVSMPAAPIMISLLWMRRAGMYGYELSLPSSRQAFVLENLIALARDYFSLWLATLVLSIAIVMLATPTSLRPDWSGLVDGIAFFGAGQFAAFAIIAWTLRFRSTLLSIFTMVIAAILSIPPLLLTMQHGIEERAMWMTVAILLALGTIVIIDAYRGWVRTSFD